VSVLVGLDVGTSGASAVAVDESGDVVAQASSEYPLMSPRPGWTEQDPEDWWRDAKEALGKVTVGVDDEVIGLGLTGQMHGSVFPRPLGRGDKARLLWNGQRTYRQIEEITEAVGEERLTELAGNPALPGFQAPLINELGTRPPEMK
jgi:xylulokinase